MFWQLMKSAPKDRRILTCVEGEEESVEVGKYLAPDPTDGDDAGETWCDSGRMPTHWQELPSVAS